MTTDHHPISPCRRCHCRSFIWIPTVLERGGGEIEEALPLALAYHNPKVTLWPFSMIKQITTGFPVASLQAYICRGCGLTDFFAKDFKNIPIGEEYGTRAVEVPSTPPYR